MQSVSLCAIVESATPLALLTVLTTDINHIGSGYGIRFDGLLVTSMGTKIDGRDDSLSTYW